MSFVTIQSSAGKGDLAEMYKRAIAAIQESDGKPFKELISGLDELVQRIGALWKRCLPAESSRSHPWLREMSTVQSYVSTLGRVLNQRKWLSCSCKADHIELLEVQDLLTASSRSRPIDVTGIHFRVVLQNKSQQQKSAKSKHGRWKWATLSATVSQTETLSDRAEKSLEKPSPKQKPAKKMLRFALPKIANPLLTTPPSAFVGDLCYHLSQWQTEGNTSADVAERKGCIGDEKSGAVWFTYADAHHAEWLAATCVHSHLQTSATWLSPGDRLQLAIKMASSLLYLHGTLWLLHLWTSKSIWVLQTEKEGSWSDSIFVSTSCSASEWDLHASTEFLADINKTIEPSLLLLGIFLVELATSQPWATLRQSLLPDASFVPGVLSEFDLAAVHRILENVRDERRPVQDRPRLLEGPLFAEVVQKCVTGDLGSSESPNLHNLSFRRAVYDEIICGLEDAAVDYAFAGKWSPSRVLPDGQLFDDATVRDGM